MDALSGSGRGGGGEEVDALFFLASIFYIVLMFCLNLKGEVTSKSRSLKSDVAILQGSYDCPDDVFCVEINYIWLLRLKQNLLLCLNFVDFTNTGLFNELNKLLNDVIFLITFEMFCMLVIPLGGFIFTYAVFCQDGGWTCFLFVVCRQLKILQ